jgi:hypothetical protein
MEGRAQLNMTTRRFGDYVSRSWSEFKMGFKKGWYSGDLYTLYRHVRYEKIITRSDWLNIGAIVLTAFIIGAVLI